MTTKRKHFYEKLYTRENSLVAYQSWEDQQTKELKKDYAWGAPSTIYDVTKGSATLYYRDDVVADFEQKIVERLQEDHEFITLLIKRFKNTLDTLEPIWQARKPLKNLAAFLEFYTETVQCWVGIDAVYLVPGIASIPEKYRKLAMKMRERSADFLDSTDRIFQLTLKRLFPELGDLVKFLTFDEVKNDAIPSKQELTRRSKHYVYFNYEVLTSISLEKFLDDSGLVIHAEKIESQNEVKGQIAMKGNARGKVRVLNFKNEIPLLKKGEILITSMTTPDYLPAMHKAAAFITDEGGITCHAAIVARELGKPCVIGTKVATQVFKTGDMVEVNANTGIIRIIK